MNALPPIFADGGTIVSVIFLVIAFLGWIMNLINGQKAQAQAGRPGKQPRPAANRLSNEIDIFLQEVSGKSKPPAQDDFLDGDALDDALIEIVPEEEIQQRRRPKPRPPVKRQPLVSEQKRRPGFNISERKGPGSGGLGTGVRRHVNEHLPEHINGLVEQDLNHDVNAGVQEHLGEFTADDALQAAMRRKAQASGSTARAIVGMLRDPEGVRRAILINEILSRPKSLRKDS